MRNSQPRKEGLLENHVGRKLAVGVVDSIMFEVGSQGLPHLKIWVAKQREDFCPDRLSFYFSHDIILAT